VAFTLRRLHAAFHNRQSRLFASNPERRVEQAGAGVILMTSLRRVTVMTQDNLRQYWIARICPNLPLYKYGLQPAFFMPHSLLGESVSRWQ
jgi:hypothetical protein